MKEIIAEFREISTTILVAIPVAILVAMQASHCTLVRHGGGNTQAGG